MTGQQLKNSILQMAVQGKLVPQDPNDEPASVLLERIRKEKEQLIKDGKIKKEKNPSYIFRAADNLPYEKVGNNEPVCIADEVPFEIPESWEWCRVGDLFYNTSGLSYKKDLLAKKSDSMVRVLRGGNIGDETYFFKEDDVFISSEFVKSELFLKKNYMITPAVSSLEHIGKIALVKQDYPDVVVGGFVLILMPYFSDEIVSQYLLYAFATKNHRNNCRNITHKSGQAFYNLSREKLMNLPVPIPPRKEMLRIINKLKVVLPIVNEYTINEQGIDKLNTNFPILLKKSILQEAIQGKLVPQDPSDEPASVLLEHIRTEKERLIQEGKIKRDKHESVIYRRDNSHYEKRGSKEVCIDDELPFEIPQNWIWCRLHELCIKLGAGSTPTGGKAVYVSNGIKFIRSQNVYNDGLRLNDIAYITDEINRKKSGSIIHAKDILLNITGGSIGRCAIVPDDFDIANVNQHVMIIRLVEPAIRQWIHAVIISEYIQNLIMDVQVGVSREGLSATKLMNFLIPLPPICEQKQILKLYANILSRLYDL